MKYAQLNTAGEFIQHIRNEVQHWDDDNYCTPEALVKDGKADLFSIVEVLEMAPPSFDPATQKVTEDAPASSDGQFTQKWKVVELPQEEVQALKLKLVPQEVSMGQCRLALYDLHEIKTDDQFYALADVVPADDRERALLQLRTRTSVRYDNELVDAICVVNGWDKAALFIYAAQQ